jgi:hypothetical protein
VRGQRWFPSNRRVVKTVVRGPDPFTTAMVASIDVVNGLGMRGGNGDLRVGQDYSRRYSGELGPQQAFRGGLMGNNNMIHPGFNTAFPATSQPGPPNRVMALLAATQR